MNYKSSVQLRPDCFPPANTIQHLALLGQSHEATTNLFSAHRYSYSQVAVVATYDTFDEQGGTLLQALISTTSVPFGLAPGSFFVPWAFTGLTTMAAAAGLLGSCLRIGGLR